MKLQSIGFLFNHEKYQVKALLTNRKIFILESVYYKKKYRKLFLILHTFLFVLIIFLLLFSMPKIVVHQL